MKTEDPSPPEHGDPVARALEHVHHAEEDLEKVHQQERRAEHELAEPNTSSKKRSIRARPRSS